MSTTQTYTLIEPFTLPPLVEGKGEPREVTQLTLTLPERMTTGFMRCTDGHDGEMGKAIAMIAFASGEPIRVIDLLGLEDFTALAAMVTGRPTTSGQTTGQTS